MTTPDLPDILCLGEPMVEFARKGDASSDIYVAGVGGDTSNAAIAAARQGANVGYLTALGRDRFGDRIMDLWHREGVDASTVRRNPDAATGLYFIDPDPAERHFTYYRKDSAASLFGPEDLPTATLNNAAILHVSGITLAVSDALREASFEAIRQVRAAGGKISFDTNLRLKLWAAETAREVTNAAARLSSVLITSIDDSLTLTGLREPEEILAYYSGLGCEVVIVTRGAEGAMLSVDGEIGAIQPVSVEAIDSTGAGDSFAGAFLAWWLETGDPWRAATLASIVAAGTVSGLGAVDPIPRRSDVLSQERRFRATA